MFFKPNEQPTEPRWLSAAPTGVTGRRRARRGRSLGFP